MNSPRFSGALGAGIVLQRFEKRFAGQFQFLFQPRRAVTVSAGPWFGRVFIPALLPIVSILNARQIEILFPVGPFFLQRRRTIAYLHPPRRLVRAKPRVLHVAQILAFRDRSLAEGLLFDCFQQIIFASGLYARSHQITHDWSHCRPAWPSISKN